MQCSGKHIAGVWQAGGGGRCSGKHITTSLGVWQVLHWGGGGGGGSCIYYVTGSLGVGQVLLRYIRASGCGVEMS